jgi:hypothetical protein
MKLKTSVAALALVLATAGGAIAQKSEQPAISSAWGNMRISQDECFSRAERVFERLRYTRIEKVGNSIFADSGNYQFAFRCVSEREMFYVYGGGPDSTRLDKSINELRQEFLDR